MTDKVQDAETSPGQPNDEDKEDLRTRRDEQAEDNEEDEILSDGLPWSSVGRMVLHRTIW